jgi:hypothetical protein
MSKRQSISGYTHKEREEKIALKGDCPFKVNSYMFSSGCWSMNVVNNEHNLHAKEVVDVDDDARR